MEAEMVKCEACEIEAPATEMVKKPLGYYVCRDFDKCVDRFTEQEARDQALANGGTVGGIDPLSPSK